MNDLEKKSIECIKNMPIEETTYQVARNVVLDYITNLQQAVKDTKETADDMLYELNEENEKLKSKIEKAVEYIEKNQYKAKTITSYAYGSMDIYEICCESNDLLNILRGKDNE